MDSTVNRQWLLAARPQAEVGPEHFEYREAAVPEPDAGQLLVQLLYFSLDPAMRPWMDDVPSYLPPAALGEPMRAAALGRVVKGSAALPQHPEGSLVQGLFSWQDYVICDPMGLTAPAPVPDDVPLEVSLGVLGGTGMTAWVGMLELGQPQAGETVLVSAAAGATGSVAAQLARIKGCRVIGIAGGPEKCGWLREACRLDAAIDYRSEDVATRLGELCPQGVELFFDNVGGAIFDAAMVNMKDHGRAILCGQISRYNASSPTGSSGLVQVIMRRLTIKGFVMIDHMDKIETARTQLAAWVAAGEIAHRVNVLEGFKRLPEALMRLFRGQNIGKQLLRSEAAMGTDAEATRTRDQRAASTAGAQ